MASHHETNHINKRRNYHLRSKMLQKTRKTAKRRTIAVVKKSSPASGKTIISSDKAAFSCLEQLQSTAGPSNNSSFLHVHSRLLDIEDDAFNLTDSQELMPPPVFNSDAFLRKSRSDSKEEEDIQRQKRRNSRSSSRSTVILSDEETDSVKERKTNYLKRSPSKQLKRSDDGLAWSIPSRASSRSTVIFSSSESL